MMGDYLDYANYEALVRDALAAALGSAESQIHYDYTVVSRGGLFRRPDIVIEHREWGLYVIEVKVVNFGQLSVISGALEQAKLLLWDAIDDLRGRYEPSEMPTGHVLVVIPNIRRPDWFQSMVATKTSELEGFLVFADELEPDRLLQKLREAPPVFAPQWQRPMARPKPVKKKRYDVFVSYRRADSAWAAGRIADRLMNEFGRDNVFLDVGSIGLGKDFREVIRTRIEATNVLVVMIGSKWLTIADAESGIRHLDKEDDFVRWEICLALEKNLLVIPVLLDQVRMPRSEHLPEALRELVTRNACAISAEHFETDLQRLLTELRAFLGKPGKTP